MKKIQCQEILSVMEPPIVGPSAGATITVDAVEGEGLRALRGRKGVGEHRLLARREAATAEPLEHACRDQDQARLGERPQASELTAKSATEIM